jgi:hypothetical protein
LRLSLPDLQNAFSLGAALAAAECSYRLAGFKKTGFGAAGALCLGHRVIPFWLWQKYQVLGEFAAVLQLPFIMKMQAEPTNVISRCK